MIRRLAMALGAVIVMAGVPLGTSLTPAAAAPPHPQRVPGAELRPAEGVSLTGAGSTFDYPFFDKAFKTYQNSHNVSINYQPIGSGAGIQLFSQQTVDFGATDVPMNPTSELPAAVAKGGPVQQIPIPR